MTPNPDTRLRDLRRMRLLATALLALMSAIFVATYVTKFEWTWLAYLRAFAEAGMIGACADWFAVVALFRHPLGLPIPHTAIVPHNKERIGGAIGRFISNNFLSPKVLTAKIREIDPVGWMARWLSNPANTNRVARRVATALPQIVRALPRDDINAFLACAVRSGIEAIPAAPLASKVLAVLWAEGETQALVERAITVVARMLTDNRNRIKVTVTQKSSRFIPKWVDAIVADKIVSGLTQLLEEMRDPAHPWRTELGAAVDKLIDDLATEPEMYARGEAFKGEILHNPVVLQQVNKLWTEIGARLDAHADSYINQISEGLEHALAALGRRMASDEQIRAAINKSMRIAALRIIAPRRVEIGAFITQVVERWDTETLVNRIELQVGRDLQYIRINGTVVGGLVGLVIFTITRWL
ncbi:MAG: DUF445 domain-containing protein [Bradyrhizobium sp.]|nr:DUF445 domain-containing protein [Bradyrhizobium sp.]